MKRIAGKKVRTGDLKVAAMGGVFILVPAWDILLCYLSAWFLGITIFSLVRVGMWAILSFGIATKAQRSWVALGSAALAFLTIVPIEMIYFMSTDHYTAIWISGLLRLLGCFGIMLTIASSKVPL